MTISNAAPIVLTDAAKALQINDDIKREVTFYNCARENVQKAMTICVQATVPIERPDDFFAEMVKSDEQMKKIKSVLLKQQNKIDKFEEKKM
jgi:rRNA-processing protein EBP2